MKAELIKIEDRGDQYNWPSVCWAIGSGHTRFDGWPKWKMQWIVDRINDGTIEVPEVEP